MMLEHFDHLVEASAKAISNIKFDKVVVWEGNAANGHSATANWLHNMARTLPPMMQVMKDIGGVEIPETLATLQPAGRGAGADGRAPADARVASGPRRGRRPAPAGPRPRVISQEMVSNRSPPPLRRQRARVRAYCSGYSGPLLSRPPAHRCPLTPGPLSPKGEGGGLHKVAGVTQRGTSAQQSHRLRKPAAFR